MSSDTLTGATVMDQVASVCMNDSIKAVYTYTVQIPFLKMALQELREHFEQQGIAVTQATSAVLQMTALTTGPTDITFLSSPALPADFVEPLQVWERTRGIDPYIPMKRVDFLPHNLDGMPVNIYGYFQWDGQKITVPACNQNNDIKIDYIAELFQSFVDQNSSIGVINAATFLQYRTGALLARNIEKDFSHADMLDTNAMLARDRVTNISSKSKQTIQTRRRPFRSGWKNRRVII